MSPDPDVYEEVARVRDKVTDLELSTTRKLGEIEATVRVVKHDNANTQQMVIGVNNRIDRFESQVKTDLEKLSENLGRDFRTFSAQLTMDVKAISKDLSTSTTESQKKFSFYAGIAATGTFIISASGVIITLAVRLLGGGH